VTAVRVRKEHPEISVEVDEATRVAVVTLDAPERRNALTIDMASALTEIIDALDDDEGVGAIVITGRPPAFCAGADLSVLREGSEDNVRTVYGSFLRVASCKVPTIAAINGPAVGAGVNLAISCDLRLVSSEARIDLRFLRLGIHPGGGNTWLLHRILGPQGAAALVLFGEVLDADLCVRSGFAWKSTGPDDLLSLACELAGRPGKALPELVRQTKDTLRQAPNLTHPESVELEVARQLWSIKQPGFQALISKS